MESEQSPDATSTTADAGDDGSVGEASPDGRDGSIATTATMFLSNTLSGVVLRYGLAPGMDPIPNDTISLPSGGSQTASGMAVSTWGELFVEDISAGAIYRFLSPFGTPVANGMITGVGPAQEIRFIDSQLWVMSTTLAQVSFDAQENASVTSTKVPGSLQSNKGMLWVPAMRDLYVSQGGANTIQNYHVGTDYSITQLAPITGNGLNNPHGMVMTPWGEMFVANGNGNSISRFTVDAQGNASPNGTITDTSFDSPLGLAFTPWGELFVVSQHSATLSRFSFDSSHTAATLIDTFQLQGPTSLNQGGFAWIVIVPEASTLVSGDGGLSDGSIASDAATE